MYNNGGAPFVAGGTLAVTGITSLQAIGMAILAVAFCISGLLAVRAAKLRQSTK